MSDKLKELTRNKAILSFSDVYGVSAAQLQENRAEENTKDVDKKKDLGNWKKIL